MPPTFIMWIHLLAVIGWIGGMLFQGFVLGPLLKAVEPPTQRQVIQARLEARTRKLRWVSLAVLIGTGMVNLIQEGGSARLESNWGAVLMLKLLLVIIALGLTGILDFGLASGPGRTRSESSPNRAVFWLSNILLAIGLLILFIAVYLGQS